MKRVRALPLWALLAAAAAAPLGCTPNREKLEAKVEAALLAGDSRGALEALDVLVEEWPKEPRYHAMRASALAALGRPHEALAAYEEALRLDPDNRTVATERALLLLRNGEPEGAVRELRVLSNQDPSDFYARGFLAYALARLNKTDATADAERIAESLLENDPRNLGALLALGYIRHQQSRFQEARRLIGRARMQAADDPLVAEMVARIGFIPPETRSEGESHEP